MILISVSGFFSLLKQATAWNASPYVWYLWETIGVIFSFLLLSIIAYFRNLFSINRRLNYFHQAHLYYIVIALRWVILSNKKTRLYLKLWNRNSLGLVSFLQDNMDTVKILDWFLVFLNFIMCEYSCMTLVIIHFHN